MGVEGQPHAPASSTPGKDPVPIVQEAGWASGPVRTGAENLAPTRIRSPDHQWYIYIYICNVKSWILNFGKFNNVQLPLLLHLVTSARHKLVCQVLLIAVPQKQTHPFKIIIDDNCQYLFTSSVGIATRYELGGPGIESRWGRDFPHPSRPTLGHTKPSIQ